ncbi:MAG: hypothetical protein ABJN11_17290 [Lentilitoribacter sp.]
MTNNYDNFSQVVDDLVQLNNAIISIRIRIESELGVNYHSQDARHVALDMIQRDIVACGNFINMMRSLRTLVEEKGGEAWEDLYKSLIGTELSAYAAEDNMLNSIRFNLLLSIHFRIENLFMNIMRCFESGYNRRGFSRISGDVFKIMETDNSGADQKTLTVLADLRNSLHNNGMHRNCSKEKVTVGGLEFSFEKDQHVECASWKHILVMLGAIVRILESILLSQPVRELTEIVDDFSSGAGRSS